MSAGIDKLSLGLERLEKGGDDPDLLGAALTSVHGALEERFRELLVTTPEVPQQEHGRILDVSRVQWSELLDLMQLYRGLKREDALLVRRMNRERQAVAHGARFSGRRAVVERYARFVQGFFPELPPPAEPLTQQPLPEPKPARKRGAPKVAAAPPAAERQAKPAARKAAPKSAQPAARPSGGLGRNPGLTLTVVLLLLIACAALGTFLQTELRADPAAPVEPIAPPLPTMETTTELATTAQLNLRAEPGLEAAIIATMPAGARVTLLGDGPQRDGHRWARVRFEDREGWADADFLAPP